MMNFLSAARAPVAQSVSTKSVLTEECEGREFEPPLEHDCFITSSQNCSNFEQFFMDIYMKVDRRK